MRAEIDEFKYSSIGDEYRAAKNKKRKTKLTPSNDRNEIDYLKALITLMMKADARRGAMDQGTVVLSGTSLTNLSQPITTPKLKHFNST